MLSQQGVHKHNEYRSTSSNGPHRRAAAEAGYAVVYTAIGLHEQATGQDTRSVNQAISGRQYTAISSSQQLFVSKHYFPMYSAVTQW